MSAALQHPVQTIDNAIAASDPQNLWRVLRIIPPKSGSFNEEWTTIDTQNNPEDYSLRGEQWQRLG